MSTARRELPGGYRWADGADSSVLYLRYGWAATVTAQEVEVRGRQGVRLRGRCGSIAQGKRFVERWICARGTGTYRAWKARWTPPTPHVPTGAERGESALWTRQQPTPAPQALPAGRLEDGWESWAWRLDVPWDAVLRGLDGR